MFNERRMVGTDNAVGTWVRPVFSKLSSISGPMRELNASSGIVFNKFPLRSKDSSKWKLEMERGHASKPTLLNVRYVIFLARWSSVESFQCCRGVSAICRSSSKGRFKIARGISMNCASMISKFCNIVAELSKASSDKLVSGWPKIWISERPRGRLPLVMLVIFPSCEGKQCNYNIQNKLKRVI